MGHMDPHLIHDSITQTVSRLDQPFLQGALWWQTDHATQSVTIGCTYIHSTVMRPNNNNPGKPAWKTLTHSHKHKWTHKASPPYNKCSLDTLSNPDLSFNFILLHDHEHLQQTLTRVPVSHTWGQSQDLKPKIKLFSEFCCTNITIIKIAQQIKQIKHIASTFNKSTTVQKSYEATETSKMFVTCWITVAGTKHPCKKKWFPTTLSWHNCDV